MSEGVANELRSDFVLNAAEFPIPAALAVEARGLPRQAGSGGKESPTRDVVRGYPDMERALTLRPRDRPIIGVWKVFVVDVGGVSADQDAPPDWLWSS